MTAAGVLFIACGLAALLSMWHGTKLVLSQYGFAKAQDERYRVTQQKGWFAWAVVFCALGCLLAVIL